MIEVEIIVATEGFDHGSNKLAVVVFGWQMTLVKASHKGQH